MKIKIEVGERLKCKKDVIDPETGVVYFTKGQSYKSEKENCITDNEGTKEHWMIDPVWTLKHFKEI